MQTAPRVLQVLGFQVTAPLENALASGNYRVREVHVAYQFWLDKVGITEFLRCMFRTLNESRYLLRLRTGEGFRLNSSSRTAVFLFYDKQLEFENRAAPLLRQRFDAAPVGFARIGIAVDREFQRQGASSGPRLEIRFGDHFFRRHPELAVGSGWALESADKLFRLYLRRLKLPRQVHPVRHRDHANSRLPLPVYRTYLLWAHGEVLRGLVGTDQTLGAHRRAILDALRIDISRPASEVLAGRRTVDASRVFRWGNRVRVDDLRGLCG